MRPAARDKHEHVCAFARPPAPTPHVGGPLTVAPREVKVNGESAAIFGDKGNCTGIGSPEPKDAIIAGCLAVFIDGQPAARKGEVTYGGTVIGGSADVFYATTVTPLSKMAADWLTRYLAQQENIPFEYAPDGCYARAHSMKEIMRKQFGMKLGEVEKIFVEGDLRAAALNGGAWGWHVAPVLKGVDAAGKPVSYVIDPSLKADGALTEQQWLDLSKGSGGSISSTYKTPENGYFPGGGTEDTNVNGKKATEYGKERLETYKAIAKATGLKPPASTIKTPVIPPVHIP